MNVTFVLNDDYKELEKEFLDYTLANNIVGVKGHRSVGGYRASIYNALPVDSVNHLISVMQKFEQEKA
jgi:phosphoserine aminotransferase